MPWPPSRHSGSRSMATLILLYGLIALFAISVFVLFGRESPQNDGRQREKRAQVLVLGDIARSPRMRNHATSLANHEIFVDLVGYVGKE